MIIYMLLSAITSSGATMAIVNVWGKIKLKKMDTTLDERQQFIKEVSDLRNLMNTLYKQHYDLMRENADLKLKVQDLEDHVNKKSRILINLKSIIESYSPEAPTAFFDKVKTLVTHYELSGR